MGAETHSGLTVNDRLGSQLADFWATLHRLGAALDETWLSSRCGFMSENAIIVRAACCMDSKALSQDLREANGECLRLLTEFKASKMGSKQ